MNRQVPEAWHPELRRRIEIAADDQGVELADLDEALMVATMNEARDTIEVTATAKAPLLMFTVSLSVVPVGNEGSTR